LKKERKEEIKEKMIYIEKTEKREKEDSPSLDLCYC